MSIPVAETKSTFPIMWPELKSTDTATATAAHHTAAEVQGFGMIHRLTNTERAIRDELACLGHKLHTARWLCDQENPPIDDLKRFLDGALANLANLTGDRG